ncbi:ATP-binding cassette domain-containing protein [Ornithinibacillus sp. L9]|uniref:ATP-binding cassette domain-containing protein n=1 Tax=Ornithinibacillus caprae TaxID=2678566 RepID=A0A6N8FDL8_9BACI|nr:ABC transporter ATP-binding protein [Ornithinibacillus caprae]MUK87495.1 ATP-binding cassette domain-containing protein [Ornithinibacillus caprae]
MEILSTENVTFRYPGSPQYVLEDINFSIHKGDFAILCGPSGSGKSTLLRMFKQELLPHGECSGSFFYKGNSLQDMDRLTVAKEIGMVFQDPDNQIVMEHVMDELLFGMENMGYPTDVMRRKVAEMVHFFGLQDLLETRTDELSGGQKQLINLASVLLLDPNILLLDEPTAQLDPIAAKEFIHLLKRLNDEFGITILIVEHRLEELFSLANRVILLDKGRLVFDTSPRDAVSHMYTSMRHFLPSAALVYLDHSEERRQEKIPLSVREAKKWVVNANLSFVQKKEKLLPEQEPFVELRKIDYQYSKHSEPVLKNLSFSVNRGEWMSLVGANGTGKTTVLKLIGGLLKPQHGYIKYSGRKVKQIDQEEIGYLPQNPKTFFLHDTLFDEYRQIAKANQKNVEAIDSLVRKFQLRELLTRHPYDLSGGEMQKAALVGILLGEPSLLLVDEPTKGMDPDFKAEFGELMQELVNEGLTVIMVTHDIEFAAHYSTRCSMIFRGDITVSEQTQSFFRENTYYTTAINRITREGSGLSPVTLEEAMLLLQKNGI